jgi:adenylate cyclase
MVKQSARRLIISFLIGATIALLAGGAFWSGLFGTWQTKLTDKLFLSRQPQSPIVILAIDDASIKEIGQWPWPRAVHARAILNLAAAKPKIVGYDIIFSEPSRQGAADDQVLVQALAQLPVVLPMEGSPLKLKKGQLPAAENLIESTGPIKGAAKYFGHVNVLADEDGVVRRLPLFIEGGGQKLPSISLRLAGFFSGQDLQEISKKTGQWLKINFVGPPGSFETISFKDVYSQKVAPEKFKDKIVLVGVTSPDLHDSQITPFSLGQKMPGVEIHANALETILTQKFLFSVSDLNVWIFIFLLSLANSLTFSFIRRIWLAMSASVALFLIYLIGALIFFESGWVFNLVHPSLAFLFSLLAILVYHYFSESKEKNYLRRSFQFYLSPEVVEEIVADPEKLKLGGQKKEMTVLFSDIRGFTTLSEKLEPEKLVAILNEYFTAMTEVILQSGGVLDKFIGDAIMAFWGAPQEAPDHAQRACRTALKMIAKLEELKKEWSKRDLPEINIGVGINSGQMIVGNMGSAKRFDYTVIGDNVNLASRLEGLNKQYGTSIIISQFTYDKVKEKFEGEFLDKVAVKGKEIPVEIFKLVGEK